MIKFISLLRSRTGSAPELAQWLLQELGPQLPGRGIGCAINVLSESVPEVADAVVETWCPTREDVARVQSSALLERAHAVTYLVSEWIEKDELRSAGLPTPAVKLIVPWEARDDVARTEVRRHWEEHVPLANRIHVGCVRYVRNWVEALAASSGFYPRPYQGFAFQYFRTHQDLVERSFDRPENRAVIDADVADFLIRYDVLLATEHVFD